MDSQYAKWFAGIANEMDTKLDPFEVAALTSYFDDVIPLQDTVSRLKWPTIPGPGGPPGTTRRYPQSTPSTLALPKIKGANEIIWPYERDVGFGENWRNDFNSLSAQHYRAKPLLQPICAQWINSNAFTARLIGAFIIDGYYWALLLLWKHWRGGSILRDLPPERRAMSLPQHSTSSSPARNFSITHSEMPISRIIRGSLVGETRHSSGPARGVSIWNGGTSGRANGGH
ncbi:hypothetical protein ASPWEDRAFT_65682 [Aspergillus wentii DTO 134E9]|uniref:Uncharacterized protein n=1 Tax=Aspergillus wentii DTO 134E9 TaxID=1073089 RepID=A0A1L9RUW1_ASPWE|nr:uncharacterized protein ASPWEDRAFT_65682 [Aspergillus wentii DTO 134E9]OJJ38705.1 hypothetical protein ASPWEDRAFT_65682 [Aspergillus wentii DTO 134E9]